MMIYKPNRVTKHHENRRYISPQEAFGCTPRPTKAQRQHEIIELAKKGLTQAQIADELGIQRGSLTHLLRTLGLRITLKKKPPTKTR